MLKRAVVIACVLLVVGLGWARSSWAMMGREELEKTVRELMEENRALAERLRQVEEELRGMKAARKGGGEPAAPAPCEEEKWFERINAEAGFTGVIMGSRNNDDNSAEGDHTDGSYSFDLNLSSSFGQYGGFFVHLEGGEGEGLNDDLPSFSIPNYDAYVTKNFLSQADVTISEAFLELGFMDQRLTLDAGKMDLSVLFDENEAAGDETTQFMNNIFVKSMGLTIPEPDNFYCPVVMLKADPVELVEFRLIGAAVEDENWTRLFDHGFVAGQVNLRPALMGMPGNYRLYTWRDERRHLREGDLPSSSYNDLRADHALTGWGVSFDQELRRGVTGFFRYSWTEDGLASWDADAGQWDTTAFDRLWTLGVDLSGALWHREGDGFGLGYGRILLTDDYEDANADSDDEQYLECYYRWAVNRHLALSGDFQWVKNPGGTSSNDDVYIFGLRSQLDF